MIHDYHEALPGFDVRQIWHDHCLECENRGKTLPHSLGMLDSVNFFRAWQRAADWNRDLEVGPISNAEKPLLELLWAMQVMFERECGLPLGELPFARVLRTMQ